MRQHRSTATAIREVLHRPPTRAGKAIAIALLALLASLHAPSAIAQTSADSTVLLLWTAPGDDGSVGRASTYDIRYRTVTISGVDSLGWWNAATQVAGEPLPNAAGATDSMRVRSLQPLTTYYFMIRTADEVPNWSGFSNVAVKSTSGDAVAPSTVADLSITGSAGTSLSLRWTSPGDDGAVGTATSYDVRYSTAPITTGNWGSATAATGEPAPAVAGTVQTFNLGGLSGSQTYYVAIRALDERGNLGGLSNVVSGTTTDTVAPAPVRDLSYRSDPASRAGAGALSDRSTAQRHEEF